VVPSPDRLPLASKVTCPPLGMVTSLVWIADEWIVAVWTVVAPWTAPVGVPMVTTTVSSPSVTVSGTIVMAMSAVVAPAGMVTGLAVIV